MIKSTEKERINLAFKELRELNIPNLSVRELYHIRDFLKEIVVYNPFYKDRPYYISIYSKIDFIIENFREILKKYNLPDDIETSEKIVDEIMKNFEAGLK